MEHLKVALAGIGGVGEHYVNAARTLAQEGLVQITAFLEPKTPLPSARLLAEEGARAYADFAAMLATEHLDIVCIADSVPHLYPMTQAALEHGVHVLTASPAASAVQDLHALLSLQEARDRFAAAGVSALAWPMALTLKRRLCEGAVGTVRAIHGVGLCRRDDAFYERHLWAGQVKVRDRYVLGGPLMTCAADLLHMAAYLAGPDLHDFAFPVSVQGELYRAGDTDAEDTACLRAEMDTGVTLCLHVTRCAPEERPHRWTIEGDAGTAVMDAQEGVTLPGEKIAPATTEPAVTLLLRRLVEVVGESDEPLLMPLAEAEPAVLLVNGAYESSRRVHPVPAEYVERRTVNGGIRNVVPDIDQIMWAAAAQGKLLSETGVPWAVTTQPFDVSAYDRFPVQWR